MRRRLWLVAAFLLLGGAVALMLYGEERTPEAPKPEVKFPRRMRPEESARLAQRLKAALTAPTAKSPSTPERPRDPLLAAIAGPRTTSAVVLEANALRYSPVGQLLLECLASRGHGNPIEEIKQRTGLDLLQDLDRVAITDNGLVLTGNFGNARWNELFKDRATAESYGDKATLYRSTADQNGKEQGPPVFATWNNQMIFVGDHPEDAQAAIDRMEGRVPAGPGPIQESQTYGEIYGVLSPQELAKVLPPEQRELADRLRSAASQIELHVDASHDVGIVADIIGPDQGSVSDLGKSLGAALSVARLQAQAQGDQRTADLLELAKVSPDSGGRFQLEMAMPLSMIEKQLAFCRNRQAPQTAQTPAP